MKLPSLKDALVVGPAGFKTRVASRDGSISAEDTAALARLITIAKGDAGQSRRVADFLLAWWNAGECGSFDLTNLWAVDEAIATDMLTVLAMIAKVQTYPDTLGYESDFMAIVKAWRPELRG